MRRRRNIKRLLRRPLESVSGVGLIEILMSTVILGIVIVPIFDTLVAGRMLTARRGERRMAHHLVARKTEQLLNAGYGSMDAGSDVTSMDMSAGAHPTNPSIVVNTRGDTTALNDVVGNLTWDVQPLAWSSPGDTVYVKQVEVKLVWPAQTPRDSVSITTLIGA